MRISNIKDTMEESSVFEGTVSSSMMDPVSHKSYHEMSDVPVVERDALSQLHANLAELENLQGRLSFLMKEVRYLMKVQV
jgi:hypothetical protein